MCLTPAGQLKQCKSAVLPIYVPSGSLRFSEKAALPELVQKEHSRSGSRPLNPLFPAMLGCVEGTRSNRLAVGQKQTFKLYTKL